MKAKIPQNSALNSKINVVTVELNYINDGQESYAIYRQPSGYIVVNAYLINSPKGYFGVKLVKYESDGNWHVICLNWGYSGNWATRLILVKL